MPNKPGPLIPKDAQAVMELQDAARKKRAQEDPGGEKYWNSFARNIEVELQLALEGKSADVIETDEGPIVTKRMVQKYPNRSRWLKICRWQHRTFRNQHGPLFKCNRKPFYFHFNEGGRGLTISIADQDRFTKTKIGLFRIYLCGYVLMRLHNKWSLKKAGT